MTVESSRLVLKKALSLAVVSGALAAALAPRAASADGGPPPLPEEAFTACASKSEGAACTVQTHDGELAGTCAAHPSDARLFCRLSAPPGPPPEAVQACADKSASDSCTVTFGGRTLDGTCIAGPDGKLACAPPRPK